MSRKYPIDDKDIPQRLFEIENEQRQIIEQYNEWVPHDESERTYIWWTRYVESGYTLLPYAGGIEDQPAIFWIDEAGYSAIATYYHLDHEREQLRERLAKKHG